MPIWLDVPLGDVCEEIERRYIRPTRMPDNCELPNSVCEHQGTANGTVVRHSAAQSEALMSNQRDTAPRWYGTDGPVLVLSWKTGIAKVLRRSTSCQAQLTRRLDTSIPVSGFDSFAKLRPWRRPWADAQRHISKSKFDELPYSAAPLDQQKRIVAEIEKQFSRLDEAVANLKRVKANLKRYKAAVLKAAVEGRLVETEAERARREGRSYETGAQLLQRILETRRSQWQGKGKYKEPAAPDTADLPELPEGWTWCGFEQVSLADKHALKAGPFGSALKKEFYIDRATRFMVKSK